MTLRGTFRDGVVYLTGGGERASLRNGERVEVTPIRGTRTSRVTRARKTSKARPVAKRSTRAERLTAFDAAVGIWKDRKEWRGLTSVEVVSRLRRRTAERLRG